MTATFDPATARRNRQRTRDHPAWPASPPPYPEPPSCGGCGEPLRLVHSPRFTNPYWRPGDYNRRPHWRHYPAAR